MKKTGVVCMMMCLAMSGFSELRNKDSHWNWAKTNDPKSFERNMKEYNDPVKLKERFETSLLFDIRF